MDTLFPNYIINLEKGTVFSKHIKKTIGSFHEGYYEVSTKDIYGNLYTKIHQMIFAEGNNFPKHLWPVDEKGQQFEVDHIIPVNDGGTDGLKNLRLCSKKDNSNNPITKENQKKARKNVVFTDEWLNNLSIAQKKAWKEGKHKISDSFLEASSKRAENLKITIYQYTLDKELVAVYNGRNKAADENGFNRERITKHCKDGKPYKGYLWSCVPL